MKITIKNNQVKYIIRLIHFFTSYHCDRHIWDVRIGKNKYRVQDVLNNYELLGTNKMEIQAFFEEYFCCKKSSTEWVYEVKKEQEGIYMITVYFDQNRPVRVAYSYSQYKSPQA